MAGMILSMTRSLTLLGVVVSTTLGTDLTLGTTLGITHGDGILGTTVLHPVTKQP